MIYLVTYALPKYSTREDNVCGLTKSVKKGGLLLIIGIETTHKG